MRVCLQKVPILSAKAHDQDQKKECVRSAGHKASLHFTKIEAGPLPKTSLISAYVVSRWFAELVTSG